MKFLNKLERKYGKYAIPNLPLYFVILLALGYFFMMTNQVVLLGSMLYPDMILKGQVWRIISWVMIPGRSPDIFTVIMLLFYYSIARDLERTWGSFRLNLYMFAGILIPVVSAFLCYLIAPEATYSDAFFYNNEYLVLSIILAFTLMYPDAPVNLYFIIPVKMKWIGVMFGVFALADFINVSWVGKFVILTSMLHFLITFGYTLYYRRNRRAFKKVQINFQQSKERFEKKKMQEETTRTRNHVITRHKCAVCGRTELDDPNLEFRFCSRCEGNYEYCKDHIFTHQHVK